MRASSTPNDSYGVAGESAGSGSTVKARPSVERATRRCEIDVSQVCPSATTMRGSLASTPAASRRQRRTWRSFDFTSQTAAAISPGRVPAGASAIRSNSTTSPSCRMAAGLNTPTTWRSGRDGAIMAGVRIGLPGGRRAVTRMDGMRGGKTPSVARDGLRGQASLVGLLHKSASRLHLRAPHRPPHLRPLRPVDGARRRRREESACSEST